mmetsp:Transcript_16561/g.45143  ORF Transcript_16561/g.45143 Transcript_16561/m.45143 type:complete len:269 (-) Transcript_16561:257-1063(-)
MVMSDSSSRDRQFTSLSATALPKSMSLQMTPSPASSRAPTLDLFLFRDLRSPGVSPPPPPPDDGRRPGIGLRGDCGEPKGRRMERTRGLEPHEDVRDGARERPLGARASPSFATAACKATHQPDWPLVAVPAAPARGEGLPSLVPSPSLSVPASAAAPLWLAMKSRPPAELMAVARKLSSPPAESVPEPDPPVAQAPPQHTMLAGLTSRCTMPSACRSLSAAQMSMPILMTSTSGSGPCLTCLSSELPSTSSMTIQKQSLPRARPDST